MDALRPRKRLRIGDFTADPATNELIRGRESVRIEPKAMDVLMLLAGRAGNVVSREEIFGAVWPGLVVGDEALSQSVTKLRRALGDDPKAPAYIETIAKRGYRLLAVVRTEDGAVVVPHAGGLKPRRAAPLVAIMIAAALGAAVAYFYRTPPRQAPALPAAGVERQESWVSITVLPFESLGPPGEQDYLAHGISADLVTALGRLSGLRMIRPASTKAANRVPAGAHYVVSGTVQREGSLLRVNVHLVDERTSRQLWSERFERPFGDLFAVQDDIIRRITGSLPAKVSNAERQRLAARHTRSLEAYEQFLRGQELFLVRGPRENHEAREFYRQALELDPKFARAYAGLAMSYAMEYRLDPGAGARPRLDRAFELAESARQIDPDIAEVHWALGFVHTQRRRHNLAIASLERAIELNPSFADAHALMAGIYTYLGEPAKSVPLMRTALRLNADGGYLYYVVLGRAYLFLDDHEQARINLREALERNPSDLEAHILLAAALVAGGELAAAQWEAEEIRTLEPGYSTQRWLETYPMTSERQREMLVRLAGQAGL